MLRARGKSWRPDIVGEWLWRVSCLSPIEIPRLLAKLVLVLAELLEGGNQRIAKWD